MASHGLAKADDVPRHRVGTAHATLTAGAMVHSVERHFLSHEPPPLSLSRPCALYTVLRNPSPLGRADETFLNSQRVRQAKRHF